jgi:hypothetical protein
MSSLVAIILLVVFVALVVAVVTQSIRIVPQAMAGIVERFGRYHRTLHAGLNVVTPFVDRLRPLLDLREQVVSFPPQPVITRDNLVVGIDTVIYFQVTDAKAATYEVANYITAVEQLTVTTLRNVVGGMDLETALTSRDQINSLLRQELDEATGKWGIRVGRVEIKAIEPPGSIQDSMEKQMRADRDKRAAILSGPGDRPKRSAPCSRPSTRAIRTSACWPTSTCRCCRRSPRATPTRSGSCRARSARRWKDSAVSSPAQPASPPNRPRPDPARPDPARPDQARSGQGLDLSSAPSGQGLGLSSTRPLSVTRVSKDG